MFSTSATRKTFVAAAALSAVVGLSACGSNDTDTAQAADSSSSASYGRPAPVATVPAVPGGTTAVALDTGFTDALTQLGLTPGVIGGGALGAPPRAAPLPPTRGGGAPHDPGGRAPPRGGGRRFSQGG